jgi:predicted PurR-regulated permease PerM
VALTISPLMFLYVLGIFLIIQAIQNYVLSPVVMRKTVGLHPLVVVLLIISGTTLFGIWGALLAIPTATIIKTIWNNR